MLLVLPSFSGSAPPQMGGSAIIGDVIINDVLVNSGVSTFDVLSLSGAIWDGTAMLTLEGGDVADFNLTGAGNSTQVQLDTTGLSQGSKSTTMRLIGSLNSGDDTGLLTVNLIGPAPVANNDTDSAVLGGQPIDIDVLANDTGVIGTATINTPSTPNLGTAAVVAGKIRYTPPASGTGPAVFTYTITDDSNGLVSNAATVTVTLNAPSGVQIIAGDQDVRVNAANPLIPTKPGSIQVDDLMYLHIAIHAPGGGQTIGTQGDDALGGWTLILKDSAQLVLKQWVYYRKVTGADIPGETISIPWARDGSGVAGEKSGFARCYAVRGQVDEDLIGLTEFGDTSPLVGPNISSADPGSTSLAFGFLHVLDETEPVISAMTGETTGNWALEFDAGKPASTTLTNQRPHMLLWSATGPVEDGTAASTIDGDWATVSLTAGSKTAIGGGGGGDPVPGDFDEAFNVETDFGAVGNNSTDDYLALKNAFAAAAAAGTPTHSVGLFFGAGKTYLTSQDIAFDNARNVTLVGNRANPPTIARRSNYVLGTGGAQAWQMIHVFKPIDVTVLDMIFDGRRNTIPRPNGAAFCHIFTIRGGARFKAYRCTWKRSQATGIKISAESANFSLSQMPVDYYFEDCLFSFNAKQAVTQDFGIGTTLKRCILEETGPRYGTPLESPQYPCAGIDFEPQEASDSSVTVGNDNCTLDECIIRNNTGVGVQLGGPTQYKGTRNLSILTCLFENNGLAPDAPHRGAISIRNGHPTPTHNIVVRDCTFRGQVTPPVSGDVKTVIYIDGLGDPSVLIESNTFESSNDGATSIIATRINNEGSGLVTIRKNTINISLGLNTASGGGITDPCAMALCWSNMVVGGSTVDKNTIIGKKTGTKNTKGIVFGSPSIGTPNGAEATANDISNCDVGIHILSNVGAGHSINITSPANNFTNCTTNTLDST